MSYLSSTSAPASSSDFTKLSASSFETPSFIGLGALSTRSLASLSPRPVNSLTNLTTASFEPPAAFKTTSNSDFSSAASTSDEPPEGPATATAVAAGSIPYSSYKISANSLTSFTVKLTKLSANFFKSAIFIIFVY